jgi:hypothetical protein
MPASQLPVPPETTVADFDEEFGGLLVVFVVVVVDVVAADVRVDAAAGSALSEEAFEELPEAVVEACCDELGEVETVLDVVDAVELAVESAEFVAPGISRETRRPSAAAAPVARTTTPLEVRRTLVRARSRRRPSPSPGRVGRFEWAWGGCLLDEVRMPAMSPGEPADPRTVS